jgi:signal transduction histidine kinase
MPSLSHRLFRDVALPAAAVLVLFLGAAWWGARALHRYQMETRSVEQIQSTKRRLRAQTKELETLGAGLAKTWASLDARGLDRESMLQAALPLLRRPTLLTNLLFCTPEGQYVTLIRTDNGWDLLQGDPKSKTATLTVAFPNPLSKPQTISGLPNYPLTRPWFVEGTSITAPKWTSTPYSFADEKSEGYSYLVPVFNAEGKRRGLISLDITTDRIHRALQRYFKPVHGQAMITTSQGEILVPPGEDESAFSAAWGALSLPSKEELHAHSWLPEGWAQSKTFPLRIRDGARRYRIDREGLSLGAGLELVLWSAIPSEPMSGVLRGVTLGFSAVLMLVLMGWGLYGLKLTRRYSRPIMNLAHSAEQAREGHEVERVDSDIWEIRKMGEQLQWAGHAVRAKQALEDQLVRAQRYEVASALSGGVIHDLNNLMTSIYGRADQLLAASSLTSGERESVESILSATQQGRRLSERLLNFSQGGDYSERLDLNECLSEAALLLHPVLHRTHMTIHLSEAPLPFQGNPEEVLQIILNLALNARDAMKGAGALELHAQRNPEGCPELWVKDNGPGIPEAIHDRIFEPYFTTKPKGKGTGLGLAVVQRVVDRMGGHVAFTSSADSGTCFRVTFPPLD